MRKLLVFSLLAALLVTALMLPPLTGATKSGKATRGTAASVNDAKRQEAGASKSIAEPVSYRAVNFGESAPIREIAAAEAKKAVSGNKKGIDHEEYIEQKREQNPVKKGGVQPRGIDGDDGEKNRTNREAIRHVDPFAKGSPDGALAYVPGGKGRDGRAITPQVLPTPNVSFEGISEADTVALGQGFLPPDTNGEIGPNHFVLTVNVTLRIYDRTGAPLVNLATIGSLFATIPGSCANTNDGDPIVLYDQLADRWIISQFCTVANPNNHQLIAVSKTPDPTGAYYLYDFMMPNNDFNDYPHFGMWPDAYYMTDNEFNQAGTSFLGAGAFAFNRAKLLAGDPTANFIYFDSNAGCPAACQFGGMLPADMDGFIPPPAGTPNTFMQFDDDQAGGAADQLRIFDFHADFATPANSTFTERTGSPLAVATFDSREVPSGSRAVVPQPAGGVNLDFIASLIATSATMSRLP